MRTIEIDENGHYAGHLYLREYPHPLPEGLVSVGGYVDLRYYKHPLPSGLVSIGLTPDPEIENRYFEGSLFLNDYAYPLPASLKHVGGYIYRGNYSLPVSTDIASKGRPHDEGQVVPGVPF